MRLSTSHRRRRAVPSAIQAARPGSCPAGAPGSPVCRRAGSRLYRYVEIDHAERFRIANSFAGDFLMTYDDAGELHALAAAHGFDTELVAMKSTHHAEMTELLIGRNLDWAR
jgi:hypothetical protein